VDSILNLGRSANVLTILSATETGYVASRSQVGIVWVGASNGLAAAKDGAALIGKSGRVWTGITAAITAHTRRYHDTATGTAGPRS